MEEGTFTTGEFYLKHFDSRWYIDSHYSAPQGYRSEETQLPFILSQLNNTFSSGRYRGRRFIEVGSGPTIHCLISACSYFEEIVLSDYVESCRREITSWVKSEHGCFDWKPIIQYVCELEGNRTPAQVEVQLRQKIKQVLRCDICQENPFHPLTVEPADCVMTCLCLENVCQDLDIFRRAFGNLVSLLNPGGALVMIVSLGQSYYLVKGQKFSCLTLNQSLIEEIVGKLGLSIVELQWLPATRKTNDSEGLLYLVALKSTDVA